MEKQIQGKIMNSIATFFLVHDSLDL